MHTELVQSEVNSFRTLLSCLDNHTFIECFCDLLKLLSHLRNVFYVVFCFFLFSILRKMSSFSLLFLYFLQENPQRNST